MDPGDGTALRQNESDAIWVAAAERALRGVQRAPPRAGESAPAVHGTKHAASLSLPRAGDVFMGCFGPNFFASYHGAVALLRRGVFDMMRVRTKLNEQVSERVLGWVLSRELSSPCSVAGDITPHLLRCVKVGGCRFGPFEKQLLAHTRLATFTSGSGI